MKISKNEIDVLNASLHITIEPTDYKEKFENELLKYKNKVQLKGFRKGKTPISAIKKMYGKKLLAETINKLLSESLNKYLVDEKLDILGQPIPADDQLSYDFDYKELTDFDFSFDMGLAPEFEVQGLEDSIERKVVEVPEESITEEIDMARKRLGTEVFPEDDIQENDMVTLHANELDGDSLKENGWETGFSVLVKLTSDEAKEELLKKKQGDIIRFNIRTIEKDKDDKYVRKYLLNLDEEEEVEIGDYFEGKIDKVSRIQPAELNQEFFDKYMGEDEVSTEEEVREKIKERLSGHYVEQTKNLLFKDIMDHLMNENDIELPEEFLKRWLKFNNENATDEVIAAEFEAFKTNLKWNLIKAKLERKFEVEILPEDIKEGFKKRISAYFGGNPQGVDLDKMADSMMKNQEQFKQVYEEEKAEKLFQAISKEIKIEEKSISLEDFRDMVKKLNEQNA